MAEQELVHVVVLNESSLGVYKSLESARHAAHVFMTETPEWEEQGLDHWTLIDGGENRNYIRIWTMPIWD